MIQHRSPVSGIATFQSKYVATAGYDNQVILWDAETQTACARAFHDHLANSCTFSQDGKFLVTASSDHTARVYSVPDMKLIAVCAGHNDDVEMAVINTELKLIATASRDRVVRLFSLNGNLLQEMRGHTADVLTILFSEQSLVSTSDDGTIRKWSFAGKELKKIDLEGVETDTLVITSEGMMAAGNDDGKIVLLKNGNSNEVHCHNAGIKRLVLDEVGARIISVSYDRKCKIWSYCNNLSLTLQYEFDLPNVIWPRSCAFLDESRIVFGTFGSSYATYDMKYQQWDLSKVQATHGRNAVALHQGSFYSIGDSGILFKENEPGVSLGSLCNFLLSVDDVLLTGGQSGEVFNALTGKMIYHHRSPLNCGARLEFGSKVYAVIGTYTGELLIFELGSHGEVLYHSQVKVHLNAVKGVATGSQDVFSVSANKEAVRISKADLLNGVSSQIHRDSDSHLKIANGCCDLGADQFASISRDLRLRIWVPTQSDPIEISTSHTHSIKCITADYSKRYIATGSYNGQVAIFDRQSKEWMMKRPTSSGISSICATPSGFAASSYDGGIYEIQLN